MRGPPRRAIHGPTRLTRRPAGLPTNSSLRSASVVDGACQIKIKSRARRPSSRPEWLKQKQGNSTAAHLYLMHCDPNVGAGLLANAVVQSAHVSLAHRLREQARSHKLTECSRQHCSAWLFCGSWLACDAGASVYQIHRVDAIAGKPAPTLNWVQLPRTGRLSGRLAFAFDLTTQVGY